MDMKKLLETVTKFAGQAVGQKPGDQWKGTDPNPPGKKLVGDSILKDLSKGPKAKTLEEELAEAFGQFNEDDLGVEEKRPGRTSDRPSREYTKNGKPSKRYTPVKDVEEGWESGPEERAPRERDPDAEYDAHRQERADSEAQAQQAKRPQTKVYTLTGRGPNMEPNYKFPGEYASQDEADAARTKLMADPKTPNPRMIGISTHTKYLDEGINWPKEVPTDAEQEHEHNRDEEENDPHLYTPIDEDGSEVISSWGIPHNEWVEFEEVAEQALAAVQSEEAWQEFWQVADLDRLDKSMQQAIDYGLGSGDLDEFITDVLNGLRAGYEHYGTEPRAALDLTTMLLSRGIRRLSKPVVDEASAEKTYVVNITKRGGFGREDRTRSTSGTISELLDYFGYTLEVGKSYEHERGRYKINMTPKNIKSLVDNLNKAASNGASNGSASTYYTVGEEHQVNEGMSSYPTDANWDRSGQMDPLAKGTGPSRTRKDPKSTKQDLDTANWQTKKAIKDRTAKGVHKKVAIPEGIESADPVEGAVLKAVQELIQQGHTEVAPEVITNMVVSATSQPFLLKDLVDANKNSPAIQHYVDSINPTKVKFSSDILTVKNENPAKAQAQAKQKAQTAVSNMASRAANRSRLGESKVVPVITAFRRGMEKIAASDMTPQAKQAAFDRLSAEFHKNTQAYSDRVKAKRAKSMDEDMTPPQSGSGTQTSPDQETTNAIVTATTSTDPKIKQQVQQTMQGLNALKSATQSSVPAAKVAQALNTATQGGPINPIDSKTLEPMMDVIAQAAKNPSIANQFKNVAQQAGLAQKKEQTTQQQKPQ